MTIWEALELAGYAADIFSGPSGEGLAFSVLLRSGGRMTQWGWRGTKAWRGLVKQVRSGGTIKSLNGKIPTKNEALNLIKEAGGVVKRIEGPHRAPNPHIYPHINYTTSAGLRGTIQILKL